LVWSWPALNADLNEFVSAAALVDVRGALGISADPGRWIDSLYVTGTALGMAFAPWNAVTFTLRRFTLFRYWLGMRGDHSSRGRA
jgi:MFS transporter, DHA2 family, multidrug resistance protein